MTCSYRAVGSMEPLVVPTWFLRFVAPILVVAALPLAVIVFAWLMGAAAAGAALGRLGRRAGRERESEGVGIVVEGTAVEVPDRPATAGPAGRR